MSDKPICYHTESMPWAPPCEMVTCACGANASCPICGYGWGNVPCECTPRTWEACVQEILAMIDIILALLATVSISYGSCAYYAPGVMERVVEIRQAGWTAGDLPKPVPAGVAAFVATPY
jgi:hypothetical protein